MRDWLQNWLNENNTGQTAAAYSLEHLDATDNVSKRETAKGRLAAATEAKPHGIINVGIFGEGTDSPSLSAVAFLEARKSPIDVIQAVGRAMCTAPDKSMGYIICPIYIPLNADPEDFLSTSAPEDGWKELGQIFLALRAHDQRIEENLAELLHLYIPKVPERVHTFIGIPRGESKHIQYWIHEGALREAHEDMENVLKGSSPRTSKFVVLPESMEFELPAPDVVDVAEPQAVSGVRESGTLYQASTPTTIITGKVNEDGSFEMRTDAVARDKPDTDGTPGKLNVRKTKARARDMINNGTGNPLPPSKERKKRREEENAKGLRRQLRLLQEMQEFGDAIRMNLLEKSGLADDRVLRDLNLLEDSINEASRRSAAPSSRLDGD